MVYDYSGQSCTNFGKPVDVPKDLSNAMSFWAPLKNATWGQGRGSGTPTYTGGVVSAGATAYYDPGDGGVLKAATSASPIFTSNGYLSCGAVENLALYASDLTQAGSWTASNITAAKTSIGPDGAANSACRLTAGAGNGTILQAITSASAARITSMWVKRITGTGNIDITQDNGGTWTTVTTTAAWTRVNLTAATAANPTVGIRIVTNADAVDVFGFQHSRQAFVAPLTIVTDGTAGGGSRTGDVLTYPVAGNVPATGPGSAMCVMQTPVPTNATSQVYLDTRDTANQNGILLFAIASAATPQWRAYSGGSAQAIISDVTGLTASVPRVVLGTWATDDFRIYTSGVLRASDAAGSNPTGHTRIAVGCDKEASPGSQLFGTASRVRIMSVAVSGADASRLSVQP